MRRDARAYLWDARAPAVAQQIPDLGDIVDFRNVLIHGYATVDHGTVWRTVEDDLARLHSQLDALLVDLGKAP